MISQDVLNYFRAKKALVTGGTGLIGRQVVDLLCRAGARVTIVSLDRLKLRADARHIYGDLTEFGFCRKITRGMDCVIHLAGIKGSASVTEKKLASHFVPTMMMNMNMLEACRRNAVPKVVYTSSIGAYANTDIFREKDYRLDSEPMDFAGWAKRMAELQVHAYRVQFGLENFAVVRPCNVYGPGDNFDPQNAMVIPSLMYRIYHKEDPLVVWGDGSAIRDFAYSRDVAEGVVLALYYGTKGSFVNLGSGRGFSVRELVETLRSFLDFSYVFDASKPAGFPKRVMDISLAREMIHYEPSTSLREGLEETWRWFVRNQEEFKKKKNYFTS
ncbi:MAG: NAD(P)-dependent oxidoreductase [Candidatus Omnitrophica bacterium]|nr:NAD(P)-dependent oxidoreductase [Candidatus Omnitrophota bacterium]MDD5575209.1 NAD(P)-dependent oxidoreductase [Candidatus Omnitrophota bacterium]